MSQTTASKFLNIVCTLEGMIGEVSAKQNFLRSKIKDCKTRNEMDILKNATVCLGSEMDHINLTMDLIEDLHKSLDEEKTAA